MTTAQQKPEPYIATLLVTIIFFAIKGFFHLVCLVGFFTLALIWIFIARLFEHR